MTDAEIVKQLDYILTCLKSLPFEEDETSIGSSDSLDLIIVRQTIHSNDLITEGRDSTIPKR